MVSYNAVELLTKDNPHALVEQICRLAVQAQCPFAKLEVLGLLNMGSHHFVRFRTDCKDIRVLLNLLKAKRGVIYTSATGYTVELPDGRSSKTTAAIMQETPLPGQSRFYRGPSIEHWE